MHVATSSLLVKMITSCPFLATTDAMAVPNEPLPKTAIFIVVVTDARWTPRVARCGVGCDVFTNR